MSEKHIPKILLVCLIMVLWLGTPGLSQSESKEGNKTKPGAGGEEARKPAPEKSPTKFKYVGVKPCAMCHKSKKQGAQLAIWKKTKHANAYKTLKSEEAKKVAAELGLKQPPEQSPECLRCHATGWNLSKKERAKLLKPRFKTEDGVQCETCHGPGEKYQKLSVMKDRKLVIKNGMVLGDEKLCRTCHNKEAPPWNPERFTTKDRKKVGFDYETYWEMIKHPVPRKEGSKSGGPKKEAPKKEG